MLRLPTHLALDCAAMQCRCTHDRGDARGSSTICRRQYQAADMLTKPTIVQQEEVIAEVAIGEKKALGSLYVSAGHQVN